ncbi:MFS transporter [Paenibacillus sp. Y412MC10]|uniref:MFS transporter n=1 Tax=Geobacillus sp. (strain Y412MC10) TaxID=481743 RepID=UPI0011A7B5D0|nr:MFS transporter [Paenibacillus sp. Y412MC10]
MNTMKKSVLLKAAILSVSAIVTSGSAMNANIPAMAVSFPTIPYPLIETISTIHYFFLIPSVLASVYLSKRIGYKRCIQTGILIVGLSGIVPVLTNNFYLILITRALFGIGIGLFNSLLVELVNYYFIREERTNLFGYLGAFEAIGGTIAVFIAGQLLQISWQFSTMIYLIAVPIFLLFSFGVPNDSFKEQDGNDNNKAQIMDRSRAKNTFKFQGITAAYIVILFVTALLYMTMGIKITSLITTLGYGTSVDGSLAVSVSGLGAILSGFLFGRIVGLTRTYTFSFGFATLGLAMLLIGISNHIWLTFLGSFLVGCGIRIFIPYVTNLINMGNSNNKPLLTSLILVAYNVGCGLSPYGSLLLEQLSWGNSLRGIFYMEAICFGIMTLLSYCSSRMRTKLDKSEVWAVEKIN